MTSIPASDLQGEGKEGTLIRVLYPKGPRVMRTFELMKAIGIECEWSQKASNALLPHTAYVEFVNVVIRARNLLERNGFWLMQDGYTPTAKYWIEPHGSSS